MGSAWYEAAAADVRLTQGDVIMACPLVRWSLTPSFSGSGVEEEDLDDHVSASSADVVVMTQACDLEHDKVANVVLSPHLALADYRSQWEAAMRRSQQNPSEKAWRGHCDDIADGLVWNLSMLNEQREGPLTMPHRIVDFHEVFTVPREFLESLLRQRGQPRLRLLPPYREHLSQAFARFFMRVGLPVDVRKAW